ncbi:tumor necrosis factor ligand superfamily member 6 [Prionailurus iriomotensis]
MQQPLNYPYPQIYWVDSRASSPWGPPGSVLPCPSSVPGRPGQRRPPPPPPPTLPPLPPPPPLPPLPLPPLKTRRDHNTGLCLLVMFFMVLVALVGLGLGMFQLFHLQKELAELRESTSQKHVASSLEKQIGGFPVYRLAPYEIGKLPSVYDGHGMRNKDEKQDVSAKTIGQLNPPSEKRELRKVAHLTGLQPHTQTEPLPRSRPYSELEKWSSTRSPLFNNSKELYEIWGMRIRGKPNSRSIPLEWEDTYGIALVSGVKYKKGGLVINDTGMYFVYSKVNFRGQSCNNQPLNHKVYMRNSKYPQDLVLMEGKMMNYCTTGQMWARSSYLGAVFNLTSADHLYVNVSELSLVSFEESKTFFGLYKL